MLKLYSDRSIVPPGKDHVPMLYPFWGREAADSAGPASPFEQYVRVAPQFFRMTSLEDADVAVLPAAWGHIVGNSDAKTLADGFARRVEAAGKNTVVFFNNDSAEPIPLRASLVFRTSLYRSLQKPNEYALPAWSEDPLDTHLNGELKVRAKGDRPVVGFCGFAEPEMRSWMRHIARWGADLLRGRRGATRLLVRPGHAVRSTALEALMSTKSIDTNFIIRDSFLGGAVSGGEVSTSELLRVKKEYISNIVESDYTLCVRGVGNFSYRLYETLSCGRIPVFVDTDCVLPYGSLIDWRKYSVYLDQADVGRIAERVADFHSGLSPSEFEQLQVDCRKLWEDYISPQGFFRNFHRHLE